MCPSERRSSGPPPSKGLKHAVTDEELDVPNDESNRESLSVDGVVRRSRVLDELRRCCELAIRLIAPVVPRLAVE